jgi:hypothetical protein
MVNSEFRDSLSMLDIEPGVGHLLSIENLDF